MQFDVAREDRAMPSMLAWICASVRIGRLESRKLGSPIRVVAPPISSNGRCPAFCSQRISIRPCRWPMCRLSAVASKPR